MRLRWDYLFWSILFFGVFFFPPLLRAVGSQQTTIIICTGLVGIVIIKMTECFTENRSQCQDKDEDDGF